MGFKFKKFYVVGGSSEFPTGTTYELRRARSELLLTKCGQALIDCNCGWQLDTSKSATLTSYMDIPNLNSTSYPYPALFFTNTISGCKLFMSYFGHDAINTYGIKDWGNNSLVEFEGCKYHCGLCISIIPEGSSNDFGDDPTIDSFMPQDATRICGTFYRRSSSASSIKFAASCNPESDRYYSYFIGATPYCVLVYVNSNVNPIPGFYTPIYATGKIFNILAHENDNAVQAKYGTIMFRMASGDYEGYAYIIGNGTNTSSPAYNLYNAGSLYIPGFTALTSSVYSNAATCGSICKSDGTWLLGGNYSSRNVIFYTEGFNQLCSNIYDSSSSSTRWTRIAMASVSNDLTNDGVVSGDGFKGYLDTDLFRVGVASRKAFFDNGKFFCAENNTNLLIGIDTDSESPFGENWL